MLADCLDKHAADGSGGLHRWAWALCGGTLVLLFIGGSVTSNDAGLAVPDWPTTFGRNMFLYPPSEWVGGRLFEHVHRLAGATVGLVTILLAGWTIRFERRRWVKAFSGLLLAAVIVQGVMGGLRVTELSVAWAVVHGCFAQLFFSATACLVLVTGPEWRVEDRPDSPRVTGSLVRYSLATTTVVFGQLLAGAIYRHLHAGLAYHVIGAVLVTLMVSGLVMKVTGEHCGRWLGRRLAGWMGTLLVLQLALGIVAYLAARRVTGERAATLWEWAVPSLHVMVGALILAFSTVLTLALGRMRRATETTHASDATVPLGSLGNPTGVE